MHDFEIIYACLNTYCCK